MTVRRSSKAPSPAPRHLSKASKAFWARVRADFALEEHHERLLQAALEAWDEAQVARAIVAKEGPVVLDRFGQTRVHPAATVARDARTTFRQLMRELDLDGAGDPDSRPPRIRGRYHGS